LSSNLATLLQTTSPHRAVVAGVVISLGALFMGLELRTPVGTLKPIDIVSLFLIGIFLVSTHPRHIKVSAGLLLLIMFYLVSTVPALWTGDMAYISKRFLQIAILISFGILICNINNDSLHRGHYLTILMLLGATVAFNVVWHVAHGHLIGWKQLGDPKSAFLFLPMCIGIGLVIHALPTNRLWISIWGILFILIIMSAERKAVLPFVAMTLAVFLSVRNIGALMLAAIIGVLAALAADAVTGGQISKRVGSIFVEQDRNEIWYAIEGGVPSSISDTARKLGSEVAWAMFAQNPFLGAGTDATGNFAKTYFANYPTYLRAAVHNEFLRMLAENGILGTGIVLAALGRSLILSLRDAAWMQRRFRDHAYIRVLIIMFVPTLTYMWYEGSGTEMFVIVLMITLAPDLLPNIVYRVRAGAEQRAAYLRRSHRLGRGIDRAARGAMAANISAARS
jgi:hypothetical protein